MQLPSYCVITSTYMHIFDTSLIRFLQTLVASNTGK